VSYGTGIRFVGTGDLRDPPLEHSHSDFEETMNKANGKSDEQPSQIDASPSGLRTEEFRTISSIKMTSIVCTPARLLDLLEHLNGEFTLRETIFNFEGRGRDVSVSRIPLHRHELEKLGAIIPRVLGESAEASSHDQSKTKGGMHYRTA
jgi:hypothetical protein